MGWYKRPSGPFGGRGEPVPYALSLEIDRRFYAERMGGSVPLPTFECLIDHLDHVAQIAGTDPCGPGLGLRAASACCRRASTARQTCPRLPKRWRGAAIRSISWRSCLGGNLFAGDGAGGVCGRVVASVMKKLLAG